MRTSLIGDAMRMAIDAGRVNPDAIFRSRSSVYVKEFAEFCKMANIRRSMGCTGVLGQCRGRIILRHVEERNVLPTRLSDQVTGKVSGRRIHRDLLQSETSAF